MSVVQIAGPQSTGDSTHKVSVVSLGGNLYALEVYLGGASGSVVIPISGTVSIAEKTILTVCGNVSSNTAIVGAVTSKRIKAVFVSLRTSYSAAAIVPILTDGNGGATIYQDLEQAISGSVSGSVGGIGGPYWICATSAGNALYLNPNGQTVYYTVSYFADDAS